MRLLRQPKTVHYRSHKTALQLQFVSQELGLMSWVPCGWKFTAKLDWQGPTEFSLSADVARQQVPTLSLGAAQAGLVSGLATV